MEQQKQKANQTNTENTTSQENLPDVDSQKEEGIKITHWKDLLHAWGKMSQNDQHQYIKLIFKKKSLDIQAKTKKAKSLIKKIRLTSDC